MTVIEYCREKTEVRELVVIRSGGYERCVAYRLAFPGLVRAPEIALFQGYRFRARFFYRALVQPSWKRPGFLQHRKC